MNTNEYIVNTLLNFTDDKGEPYFNKDWVLEKYNYGK